MFRSTGCSLLRAEGFSCSLCVLYGGLGITKLQFFLSKNIQFFSALYFFNFWSSKSWIQNWIRIRNQENSWIRIRIRIKINADPQPWLQHIIPDLHFCCILIGSIIDIFWYNYRFSVNYSGILIRISLNYHDSSQCQNHSVVISQHCYSFPVTYWNNLLGISILVPVFGSKSIKEIFNKTPYTTRYAPASI